MNYPRLLYKHERATRIMPEHVLEDLKLNDLLPAEVCGFLLRGTEKNDILLRQDMFSRLLNGSGGGMADISDMSEEINTLRRLLFHGGTLYRALNQATCESAEAYIFPFLLRDIAEFSRRAAGFKGYGELFDRFSEVFEQSCGDRDFISACGQLEEILDAVSGVSSVIIKTDGDSAKVLRESPEDLSAALRSCAKELGITLSGRGRDSGREENGAAGDTVTRTFALQRSVAEAAAKLNPEVFEDAVSFYHKYRVLIHGEIFEYIEELDFISGILDFTRKAESTGIPYSFPTVIEEKKLDFRNIYDVTLMLKGTKNIVPNDAFFCEKEPFFYLTGANGGGKTTFLRALGAAVVMFLAGAPVFCEKGEACMLDGVFTHFPRDERFEGSGRFFDEIRRVEEILASPGVIRGNSLILLNETYATTGEDKALEYTASLALKLYKSGNFGLYITHQHELSENVIPFLGVMIDESDSNRRTYRIEKRRLPPRSFAHDILEKYGLTREALEKRFGLDRQDK